MDTCLVPLACFLSKSFKLFGFPTFQLRVYLMNVIPELDIRLFKEFVSTYILLYFLLYMLML